MKTSYVYIVANDARTTYIGVTNDLERRVWEHRTKRRPSSFSAKYGLRKLVYIEDFASIYDAITREKQLKNWRRSKKMALSNKLNPDWDDLAASCYDSGPGVAPRPAEK